VEHHAKASKDQHYLADDEPNLGQTLAHDAPKLSDFASHNVDLSSLQPWQALTHKRKKKADA